MTMRNPSRSLRFVAFIVTILFSLSSACAAATLAKRVTIGEQEVFILPPVEFVDPAVAAPELVEIGKKMVAPTNRLLAIYIPTQELKNHLAGKEIDLNRYSMLQTSNAAQKLVMSQHFFDAIKQTVKDQSSSQTAEMVAKAQTHVNSAAASIGKIIDDKTFAIKINDFKSMGLFNETPTSISTVGSSNVFSRAGGEAESTPIVYASTVVLVKGKALFLYTYSGYRTSADLQWVKDVSTRWADEIQRSN